jgi:hypothetical protein
MIINYEDLTKVKFKNYIIDDQFNKKLFDTLNQFLMIAKDSNLNYFLTGSVLLAIKSRKIYRTLQDIDIIVDPNDHAHWLNIFNYESWFFRFLNSGSRIKVFNIQNDNFLELLGLDYQIPPHLRTKEFLLINNHLIPVQKIEGIFYWKSKLRAKKTDFEDKEFYANLIH